MVSLGAEVQRAEVAVTLTDGTNYRFVLEPTVDGEGRPEHSVTWSADIQRPAREVTDYEVDHFRRFEPGPFTFGDIRFSGPIVETKRFMQPAVPPC